MNNKSFSSVYGLNSAKEFSIKYFGIDNEEFYNDENIQIFYKSSVLVELIKTKKNLEKIKIFIFTNCQGMHFTISLNKISIFKKYFEITHIHNWQEINDEKRLIFNKLLNEMDIFIYQYVRDSNYNSTSSILPLIPDRVIKISMPYIYCNWYWLFGISWDDTIQKIKDNNNNNLTKDEIKYILEKNKIDFEIEKRIENSLNILKTRENNLDIKVHDFIKNNYKKERLFFNKNHVTTSVIIYITNELLRILEINIKLDYNTDLGIYNSHVFQPISSYIKNLLKLEFEEDSYGDNFYVNFFYDIINNIDKETLKKKYELCENKDIFVNKKL